MSARPPALFRRYPALAGWLDWLPLGRFPTPIEPLAVEGAGAGLWVKRDDLSGEAYGGNKVRKLEFLLAEARRRGARRLITAGAVGSNHALATAVYGRAHGFEVSAVLFPQPPGEHARQTLMQLHAQGAELRWAPHMTLIPAALQLTRLAHRRDRPYVVAPGGSDAYGTLGYVSAALELEEQLRRQRVPVPGRIFVAAGTMGTAAGLAIGAALAGLPTRVVAVRITSRLVVNRVALRRLVTRTLALLSGSGVAVPAVREVMAMIELRGGQIGAGYGHATPQGERAAAGLGAAGLRLDPTYTAKAAAALLDAATAAADGGVVLFWHTLSAHAPAPADTLPPPESLPPRFRRWLLR